VNHEINIFLPSYAVVPSGPRGRIGGMLLLTQIFSMSYILLATGVLQQRQHSLATKSIMLPISVHLSIKARNLLIGLL